MDTEAGPWFPFPVAGGWTAVELERTEGEREGLEGDMDAAEGEGGDGEEEEEEEDEDA